MAPLTHFMRMYGTAHAAMLAAIEIYNKAVVEHREQTFSILFVSAWEIFFKARIVQQNGNDLRAIYVRDKDRRRFLRDRVTGDIRTINLHSAMEKAKPPRAVQDNVRGMARIRNTAIHLGTIAQSVRTQILYFGTAGIQSFARLCGKWFDQSMHVPYLLPLGFVGSADLAVATVAGKQRELLRFLEGLSDAAHNGDDGFHVAIATQIHLNPTRTGGATIGVTNDPSAPKLQLDERDLLDHYSSTYADLMSACRSRYSDFKCNNDFYAIKAKFDADPACCHERRLDPTRKNGIVKKFYNLEAVFNFLDGAYTAR